MADLPPLPEELEDRAWAVLLGEPAARAEAFAELLAAHPEHGVALRHLQQGTDGAEAALRRTGLSGATPPTQVGPYRCLRRLGEGGFGVVWLAEQDEPIRRQVALKLIRAGMDTTAVLRRFDLERQLLARLEHPCVARVLDAGVADGVPFLVTEFVPGEAITNWCDHQQLALRARLELFLRVCDGVQHAHQRGIVHRDLKPSNILVTAVDSVPWPKLIDFGLARPTALTSDAMTRAGAFLGTPEYMSPEQALDPTDVDTRTDVYALGVLLFELLVGDLPHGRQRWRQAALPDLLKLIQTDTPRPSASASPQRRRALLGDLDWITLGATRQDRERRYSTVAALAADVRAFLELRPITAVPPSTTYHLRRFVRRHRVEVVAAALVLGSLVLGLVLALVAWRDSRRAEGVASRANAAADARLREFRRLANVVRLRQLQEAARNWPELAERAAFCTAWLAQARHLLAARADVAAALSDDTAALAVDGETRDAMAFARESLRQYLVDLDALVQPRGQVEQMQRQLDWATSVHQRTVVEPAAAWRDALAAIATDERYGGLRLTPQLGLVPLGRDPESGLFEFQHAQSGQRPERDDHGILRPDPDSAIVLVLVPGGTAHVGAQADDPRAPWYDRAADRRTPPVAVTLEPFFVAKHELTRGQWERAFGPHLWSFADGTPTGSEPVGALFPADNLSWSEVEAALRQIDLELPTNAQWEHACRAGTTTVWSCGDDPAALAQYANLAGREVARMDATTGRHSPEHEDRFVLPAPVGSLRANAFGLFDMHGNVAELCLDSLLDHDRPMRPGDGMRDGDPAQPRGLRGGAFTFGIDMARSAAWGLVDRDSRIPEAGVRPVRRVQR